MEGLNQLIQELQQLPQERRNLFLKQNLDFVDLVKVAILSGADATADENDAICKAAKGGYIEIVKLLIEAGANVKGLWADHEILGWYRGAKWLHAIFGWNTSAQLEVAELLMDALKIKES